MNKALSSVTALAAFLMVPSTALAGGAGQPFTSVPMTNPVQVTYYPSGGTLPFSEAVEVGNVLYLSGQIGFDAAGKLVGGGVQAETRQTLENIEAVLNEHGYTKQHLVKCMVMLTDMKDFAAMNQVYSAWMVKPYPVRSTFGVSGLAAGASVEIECMAAK